MKRDKVKRLLERKTLSGREVGQVLMAGIINDIKNATSDNKMSLFSQDEFNFLQSKLIKDSDMQEYDVYVALANSFKIIYNTFLSYYYQIHYNLLKISDLLNSIIEFENNKHIKEKEPIILTSDSYKTANQEVMNKKREQINTYASIFSIVLRECLKRHNSNQQVPKEIESAIVEYSYQYSLYNKSHELDTEYILFNDGSESSRIMKSEAEQKFKEYDNLITSKIKLTKLISFVYEGTASIRNNYKTITGKDLAITDKELLTIVECNEVLTLQQKCVLYTLLMEKPITITTPNNYAIKDNEVQEVQQKHPKLFESINNYIEITAPITYALVRYQDKFLLTDNNEKELMKVIGMKNYFSVSAKELAETDTLSERLSFLEKRQLVNGGVAVLQNNISSMIDWKRYRKDFENSSPEIKKIYARDKQVLEDIDGYYRILLSSISYIYTFSDVVDTLMELFAFKNDIFSVFYKEVEKKAQYINKLIYLAHFGIYGDITKKSEIRSNIKATFPIIDIQAIKDKKRNISDFKKELRENPFTKTALQIIQNLDSIIENLSVN